jgi:hypothetical protein
MPIGSNWHFSGPNMKSPGHRGRDFQSPLHRGRLFNLTQDLEWTTGIRFQSPLRRGRLFNEPEAGDHTPGEGELSVPSSSGKTLQPGAYRRKQGIVELSVPSSSGKTLQLGRGSPGRYVTRRFQSPLHRGRLFNGVGAVFGPAVPLSFSPLFIGEDSSTRNSRTSASNFIISFSPLFIGEDSSTQSGKALLQQPRPFSPLFIGEDSSTLLCVLRGKCFYSLSVPSSSGKTLQRYVFPCGLLL